MGVSHIRTQISTLLNLILHYPRAPSIQIVPTLGPNVSLSLYIYIYIVPTLRYLEPQGNSSYAAQKKLQANR